MPADTSPAAVCLALVAARRPVAADWLRVQPSAWTAGLDATARRALLIAFAQAVRQTSHQPLAPTSAECAQCTAAQPGWDPSAWSLSDAARGALLTTLPDRDRSALVTTIDDLAARADLHELVALYRCLPLLPRGELWALRAAEGVRSSMGAVFAAVALDNPYPAEHLDEEAWNQLILKALFSAVPVARIVGLDQRANPRLTRMLSDYAHERWAAKRPIPSDLWPVLAACADDRARADLTRAAGDGDPAAVAALARLTR